MCGVRQVLTSLADYAAVRERLQGSGLGLRLDSCGLFYAPLAPIEVHLPCSCLTRVEASLQCRV